MPGLGEELADYPLGEVIFALAVVIVTNAALRIDEVVGGPVTVLECAPQTVPIVRRYRVGNAEILDRLGDVRRLALECELGRMDADHDQPVAAIFLPPGFDVRDRAQAVDAAVGPEIDQHDLALELLEVERRAV